MPYHSHFRRFRSRSLGVLTAIGLVATQSLGVS